MALINCPECGHQISDKAISCPQCGYPLKDTNLSLNEQKSKCEADIAGIEEKKASSDKKIVREKEKIRLSEISADVEMPKAPSVSWKFIISMAAVAVIGMIFSINGWQTLAILFFIFGFLMPITLCTLFYRDEKQKYLYARKDFESYKKDVLENRRRKMKEMQEKGINQTVIEDEIGKPEIKCPNCGSVDTETISTGAKVLSTAAFGLASGKIGKNYKCRHCGYIW